jgi:hypothetical protein
MKLIIKGESGLILLRPSRSHRKIVCDEQRGMGWAEARENGRSRQLYPQEVRIAPGAHEVERSENPFVPGGEPWLVLRGSRIGAAEAYLKRLAIATRGTDNGVELVTGAATVVVVSLPPQSTAA